MANKTRNTIRPYYSVGITGLVLLLLPCIWYFQKQHAPKEYRAVKLAWWSPDLHDDNPDLFPKEDHPDKKYTTIHLTGNNHTDKIKLDYTQLLIRELVASQDTSIGIHFHFSDESKHWTLIRAIDICRIEKARIYIPYENDMWVVNPDAVTASENNTH